MKEKFIRDVFLAEKQWIGESKLERLVQERQSSVMRLLSLLSALLFATGALACGGLHVRAVDDAVPTFVPIPPSSASLPLGPGGYAVESYGKGAYMVTEGSYQGPILSLSTTLFVKPPSTLKLTIPSSILPNLNKRSHRSRLPTYNRP